MYKHNNRLTRRRIANAYISGVISISLVLLLTGIAVLLVVNAGAVSDYFRETMQISVLMKQEVDETVAGEYADSIANLPYVRASILVSRDQGTQELKSMLGEGFLDVFETSPVPVSVNVTLLAEYVEKDSLSFILPQLSSFPVVDEVSCQQSLVESLNSGIAHISIILSVFIALLLFISFVLINNMVRISVYNRRFTIHTMQLVGATVSFIRKPFLVSAVWQGLLSAFLAIASLSGLLYALRRSFESLFSIFRPNMFLITAGVVVFFGVLICLVSTFIVVGKLVSSTRDDLYY